MSASQHVVSIDLFNRYFLRVCFAVLFYSPLSIEHVVTTVCFSVSQYVFVIGLIHRFHLLVSFVGLFP